MSDELSENEEEVDRSERSLSELLDTHIAKLQKFWWLRGVFGAWAIIVILASFLNLEQYEIARAMHAAIVGWNHIAKWLGELIDHVPFLPTIQPEVINSLIFVAAVSIPSVVSLLPTYLSMTKDGIRKIRRKVYDRRYSVTYYNFISNQVVGVLWLTFAPVNLYYYLVVPFWFHGGSLDAVLHGEPVMFADIAMFGINPNVWVYLIYIVFPLAFALRYLPGYAKGVVYLLGALAVVEVLYFLPMVGEIVRGFTDAILSQ